MKKSAYFLVLLSILNCKGQEDKNKKMEISIYKEKLYKGNTNINIKQEKNKMSPIEIKNKSYRVYTNLNECQAELLIDDALVFNYIGSISTKGKRTSLDIPINTSLLKSGKHELTLKIYPPKEQNTLQYYSYGSITLHYFNKDNYDQEVELFTQETPNGDEANLNNLPYYELKAEFNVELPFSIEGWTNSVNLKEEMGKGVDIKTELQNKYDEIRTIIKNHDTEAFSKLIQEREALLGTAFYSSDQQKKDDLEEFLEIIKNPDYELQPYPQKSELHFYGYGKLITLLTPEREGVIELINKKIEKTITLDFYFHRKQKGGKLEVIL